MGLVISDYTYGFFLIILYYLACTRFILGSEFQKTYVWSRQNSMEAQRSPFKRYIVL